MSNDDLPLYQIVDYDKHFENYKSKTIENCSWFPMPNKHGGAGWSNLMAEPDGAANYGIWVCLVAICSRKKPPRLGYLTDNGKRDGRRYCVAELSRLLRRPAHEIRACLRAVTAPEVGFMALIEGTPEGQQTLKDTPRILEGYSENTKYPSNEDTPRIPGGYEVSSRARVEGRNEGKKEVLSLEPGAATEADPIQHKEAKQLFAQLSLDVFERELRETQWPHDCEYWLDKALPLARGDFALIDWFYRLPEDHDVFKMTSKRQTLVALLENLHREVEKIRSVRKKIGLNGLHSEKSAPAFEEWNEKRRTVFERMFPGSDPGPFHLLEREMREKIDTEAEKE